MRKGEATGPVLYIGDRANSQGNRQMKWERSPSRLWDWVSYGPPILYVRKILDEWECRSNSREGKSAIGKTRDEAATTYLKATNAGNERKMK